jgi:glycosyltransferase involved in cell wall biosynthesis
MKVSVCVPAYERPEMLAQLIETFAAQDHDDRELCISDDSPSDAVARIVEQMAVPGTVYQRNPINLGYARNLHAALSMATGEVIVILGDDDLFASPAALSKYAAAFDAAPHADFAYSNLVQVDASLHSTLLYPFFKSDVVYSAGIEAIENLLLRSILITGIGLRRSSPIERYYPSQNMLFPQVEMVGRLLANGEGIGISSFLCATRAHSDQLGFKAIKGQRIKGGERHGNVEIMEITRGLIRDDPSMAVVRPSIERNLLRAFTTNLVNEKILTGNRAMARNAYDLIRNTRVSGASLVLVAVCVVAIVLPTPWALAMKNAIQSRVADRQFDRAAIDIRDVSSFWKCLPESDDQQI